jgi:cytochrome c oxidase subunit 4
MTRKKTTLTGIALLALWAASWGMSSVDLGSWSFAIALVIAAAKAALVIFVFMELATEATSVHATLAAAIAMVAILLVFIVADVKTREAPPLLPPISNATPDFK